ASALSADDDRFQGTASFSEGEQTAQLAGHFKLTIGELHFPHKNLVYAAGTAHLIQKPTPNSNLSENKITLKFKGLGTATANDAATFKWTGKVIGGTGAFKGKTGTWSANGRFGLNIPGDIELAYVVTIK